ncbi:hypothetical protein PENTCL1PPCAC_21477, partial [Pristionchus entomophagus]
MLLSDWALIAYALYVPLLITIYLLELMAIFRHKKTSFNSSFYNIFIVLAAVNVTACVVATFVFRLPLYPIVNRFYASLTTESDWLTAAYVGCYYLNCLSEFLGVFLAFNRFTALYFPARHHHFWRWAFIVGLGICLIVSIAPVAYLFHYSTMFFEFNRPFIGFNVYYLVPDANERLASIWINMLLVSIVCNSLSSLLYGACLIRLCLFSIRRNQIAERNLFLVGLLTMIFSLPYMTAMLPWLTDLKYLTPAPMLLLTNSSIRRVI